jgi:hypothetical protein
LPYLFMPCGLATPETSVRAFQGAACDRFLPFRTPHAVRIWGKKGNALNRISAAPEKMKKDDTAPPGGNAETGFWTLWEKWL